MLILFYCFTYFIFLLILFTLLFFSSLRLILHNLLTAFISLKKFSIVLKVFDESGKPIYFSCSNTDIFKENKTMILDAVFSVAPELFFSGFISLFQPPAALKLS